MSALFTIQISLIYLSLLRAGPLARLQAPLLPVALVLGQATTVPIALGYIQLWNAGSQSLLGATILCFYATILFLRRQKVKRGLQKELRIWEKIGLPSLWIKPRVGTNLLRRARIIPIIVVTYFAISLIIALSSNVTNGDAQIYHISRLITFLTQGTAFLSETSMARHAYAELFHDLQYIFDLGEGNTFGLGVICWLENLMCFVLVAWLGWLLENESTRSNNHPLQDRTIGCSELSQLIYICLPMPFFQSVSVKNDLALVLLVLALIQQIIILFSINCSSSQSVRYFGFLVSLVCLTSLSGSKAYGLLALPGLAALAITLKMRKVGSSFCLQGALLDISSKDRQNKFDRFLATGLTGLVLSANIAIYSYHSYISRTYWHAERSNEVMQNLTLLYQARPSLNEIILNPLKIFFEWIIQAPLPKRVDLSGLISNVDFGPYSYKFGGYFGEDIAWPGLGFTILCVILALFALTKRVQHGHSGGLSLSLCLYSVVTFLALSQLIYWQPWYSRFIGIALIPLLPVLGLNLSRYLEKNSQFSVFLLIIIPLTTFLAIIKTTALFLISAIVNPSFYTLKSHGMRLEDIRSSLSEIKPGEKILICSDSVNSPSLYPMQVYLRLMIERGKKQGTFFPSLTECIGMKKNSERDRSSIRIKPLDIYRLDSRID